MRFLSMAAAVLLAAAALAQQPRGAVHGTVAAGGEALAGCVVTISSGSTEQTDVSDDGGGFAFDALPPGHYRLLFELTGFRTREETVQVGADRVVLARSMAYLDAGRGGECLEHEPATSWDLPPCADYDLNTSLIEGARRNDRSAIVLLQQRYAATRSWDEKARLGGELLGRIPNDASIWKELETNAENLLRFSEQDEQAEKQLRAFCAQHGYARNEYMLAIRASLLAIEKDPRARPLLLRALQSTDQDLVTEGVYALASRHDASALPMIKEALEHSPSAVAQLLVLYQSDAADEVAMPFLYEADRERYQQWRHP